MSTRNLIAVFDNETQKYLVSYCHWDWHWSPDLAVLTNVENVIREYKENVRGNE